MKKFLLSVAVLGLSVGVLAAGPKGGGNGGGGPKGNGPGPKVSGPSGPFKPSGGPSIGIKPNHTGGSPSGSWKNGFGSGHAYVQKFGKSFSGGFCFPGKSHCHWTYSCFSPKYGCNCYWCPYTTCYYYWCEPACCYYPISYIAVAPPAPCPPVVTYSAPVQVQTQTQVQVQTQTQAQAQGPVGIPTGGTPPPGIPALPQ
jgi:hypothetical protein